MSDHVNELRAKADEIERDSQHWRTRQPWAYHCSRRLVCFLRWRAADIESYTTPAGRMRSARRWILAAIALATLAVADRLAYDWWHWPDLSLTLNVAAFIAMGVWANRRGWADGYEARRREGR